MSVCGEGCLLSLQLLTKRRLCSQRLGWGETTFLFSEGNLAFPWTCPGLPEGQQTEAKQLPAP